MVIPSDILTPSEQELVLEALHGLLKVKQEAFETIEAVRVKGMPMMTGQPPFTAADFGIPKIQAIIEKLNAG